LLAWPPPAAGLAWPPPAAGLAWAPPAAGLAWAPPAAGLSGGGQSGPAGQEATRAGVLECGLRPWATNRSIRVAPGSSTRAKTSSAWPRVTSTQQTCWLRT